MVKSTRHNEARGHQIARWLDQVHSNYQARYLFFHMHWETCVYVCLWASLSFPTRVTCVTATWWRRKCVDAVDWHVARTQRTTRWVNAFSFALSFFLSLSLSLSLVYLRSIKSLCALTMERGLLSPFIGHATAFFLRLSIVMSLRLAAHCGASLNIPAIWLTSALSFSRPSAVSYSLHLDSGAEEITRQIHLATSNVTVCDPFAIRVLGMAIVRAVRRLSHNSSVIEHVFFIVKWQSVSFSHTTWRISRVSVTEMEERESLSLDRVSLDVHHIFDAHR